MSEGGKAKNNLGRGLAALLGEEDDYSKLDQMRAAPRELPVELLHPSDVQPRVHFDLEALQDLSESIRDRGILQPILVRRHPDRPTEYEIVAGERRWRAAQMAQLHEVPVVIRELDDAEALEIAIVENVQRQDLNIIEEAAGYRRLMEDYGHSQEALGQIIGKSRPHIANTLRLLKLPETLQKSIETGQLSAGHGRALLSAENPEELAERIVAKNLSVRETEKLVQREKQPAQVKPGKKAGTAAKTKPTGATGSKDSDTLALERDLSNLLGLKVAIDIEGEGGAITIEYKTLDQLDDVLRRLNQSPPAGNEL